VDRKIKDNLLLYCLNMRTDETEAVKLEQFSADDWDEIIQKSFVYGVAPLLYHRFKANNIGTHIPARVMQTLQKMYLRVSYENMQLYRELSILLKMLRDNDIAVIVLKGAALGELVYQNPALRPMFDVDLLVKTEDIWRIDKLLSQAGYESNIASLFSKRHIRWVRHIKYRIGAIRVEFHPKIYELPNLDPWVNASAAKIASIDTLILRSEDFLLHLCLHVLDHYLRRDSPRLIQWCDIAEFLKHYKEQIHWDYVIQTAKENQVEGPVYSVLHVIDQWFGGQVPANIFNELKNDGINISINDVLNPTQNQSQQTDSLLPYISFTSKIPSIYSKIYHVFRCIFPCREYMMCHYSVARPRRVYLYYFIRIGKGVIKVVKTLYQLPGYLKNMHAF
jgi:hypothetical protein